MPKAFSVERLSSESSDSDAGQQEGQQSAPAAKRRRVQDKTDIDKASEAYLRSLIGKQCPCKKRECLLQFAEPSKFAALAEYRSHWLDLEKLDQDTFALDRMKTMIQACEGDGNGLMKWSIEGVQTCRRAWKALHNMGTGRCQRIFQAAQKRAVSAPVDLRSLIGLKPGWTEAWSNVISWMSPRASSRLGKASICLRFRLLPAPDPFTISPNALQIVGVTSKDRRDFRDYVYKKWDNSSLAPAKTRPSEEGESSGPPDLVILAWQNGSPHFPDPLLSRFAEGTEEHAKMKELKEEMMVLFPTPDSEPSTTALTAGTARAGGFCDFGIDDGAKPVDITKAVSLTAVADTDFEDVKNGRLAMAEGKSGRPSILISSNLHVWVGNATDSDTTFTSQELFGFGVGSYEEKSVRDVSAENTVLPFRLANDLTLVAYEKKPQAVSVLRGSLRLRQLLKQPPKQKEKPETSDVPSDSPPKKRPSALRKPAGATPGGGHVSNPYKYPDGIWGIKVDGKQVLTVGGKYRDIEKCHEIACVAAAELRKGTKLEDVRSMVAEMVATVPGRSATEGGCGVDAAAATAAETAAATAAETAEATAAETAAADPEPEPEQAEEEAVIETDAIVEDVS
eukprot:g19927.t1